MYNSLIFENKKKTDWRGLGAELIVDDKCSDTARVSKKDCLIRTTKINPGFSVRMTINAPVC